MTNPARTAADPGLPIVTRRSLLAAAPALGLAAVPALAEEPETEVQRTFRDWLVASHVSANLPAHMSDEETEPFHARSTELSDRIVDLRSASIGDFVLKLAAHTYFFVHDLSGCPGEAALLAELEQVARELVPESAEAAARFRSGEA